jgi:hypothetical protein
MATRFLPCQYPNLANNEEFRKQAKNRNLPHLTVHTLNTKITSHFYWNKTWSIRGMTVFLQTVLWVLYRMHCATICFSEVRDIANAVRQWPEAHKCVSATLTTKFYIQKEVWWKKRCGVGDSAFKNNVQAKKRGVKRGINRIISNSYTIADTF